LGTLSTPTPREIYVEHLISQNRNSVTDVKLDGDSVAAGGTMSLLVGNTYSIQLVGNTATNGYEQIESFINFPNTIFQVNSVTTTYTANAGTDSLAATKPYADGCGWINNPTSPNYRSCTSTGKYGGDITVTYNVTIIGGGGTDQTLNTLIYDFSGSSYHYNGDFSTSSRIASIVDPAASVTFAKAFSPSSTVAGGTSTLTFLITNPTSTTLTGVNFSDDLPTSPGAMTVAGTPNATTSGCGSPTFTALAGAASISFADGTLAPNGTCVISVSVSVPAAPTSGTYSNVSDHLFLDSLDTGKFASADLTLTTATAGTGVCDLTLAQWVFPTDSSTSSPAPSTANVTASASPGAGIVSFISTQDNTVSPTGTGSWGSNGGIATGALNTANNDYFEFALDTTGYSAVYLQFDSRRTNNGPRDLHVYYGTSATPPGTAAYNLTNALTAAGTWFSFGASDSLAFTSGLNPSGTTYFRIYAAAANNSVPGSDVMLDNVTFTGCAIAEHPTLSKAFLTDPIAVDASSTLTFTLTNPNDFQLTGVQFTDTLPSGLEVAAVPNAGTTCSGSPTWSPSAGATSLIFGTPTGATLAASASCTVSVDIKATTSGPHTNVSGFISSTESGTNSGGDGSASDTLTALQPPSISKLFNPNPILSNGTSTLTFTISNPNPNNSLTAIAFTDTFPSGLTVSGSPAAAQCNGTVSSTSNSVTLTGGSISAGGSCTVTVNVTASVPGDYDNTSGVVSTTIAGVTSNGNTASDTLTVNAPNPGISLLKQISSSASGPWSQFITVTPGSDVYYLFTIENTGDVPLSPVSVTDATVSTAGCTWPASLPVASPIQDPTATCVVGPITALAGDNPNTATAHGTYSATVYDSDPSSADYLGASAGFSLLKQVGTSASGPWSSSISGIPPGSDIYYKFTIINTGSLELSSINVTDPDVSTGSCTFTDPLAVNDATTCVVGPISASLTPGTYPNTAVAHGTNSATIYDTAPSTADYTVTLTPPDLMITKSNDAGGAVTLPTPFTWTLKIENGGSAGDAIFADGQTISSDPLPAAATYGSPSTGSFVNITNSANISCAVISGTLRCTASGAAVTIGAGGSFTVSLSVTPTTSGTLSNTATVDPLGNITESDESNNTSTDQVTVTASGPELNVSKLADVSAVDTAGDVISYTITLNNTGSVMLTGVDISDPLLADLDCDGTPGIPFVTTGFTINVGSSLVCTGTYTLLQSDLDDNGGGDGDIDNTVTVASDQLADQTASETVEIVQTPNFTITKDADVTSVDAAGDQINYTVTVTNTGNLTLTGLSVSDPMVTDLAYASGDTDTDNDLDVGEAWIYTGTYTVTQADMDAGTDLVNTVTAETDQAGPASDVATVTITQNPAFTFTKVADVSSVNSAGDVINYTITLTNTGNVTLTGVTITDTRLSILSCAPTQPGSVPPTGTNTMVCTGSYTVTQSDINAGGTLDNTATADTDQTGTQDANESVDIVQGAALTLTKSINSGDPYSNPGETLEYEYEVENTGNVSLAGPVTVSDDKATVTCPDLITVGNNDGNLDPDEIVTCTASYTVLQADLDAGNVTNTATASADGTNSNQDSATATGTQTASFTLTKVADVSSVDEVGDVINYTITLTNTGNVALTGVTITDTRLASLSCTPTQPGSVPPTGTNTMVCTGSYTVTQTDINTGGTLDNTATADTDQTGTQDANESVTVVQQPLIGVAKQLTGTNEVSAGTYDVSFDILVQNYGNVPLSALQVSDDLSAAFPSPTTFTVQSLSSSDFSVNGAYNGGSDINLLTGADTLDIGESGTISLVVQVTPASAGPFNNTAVASGTSPDTTTVNDDSQDGTDPDENNNDDPTDDTQPTPVDFGPNLFDPPFGLKVFDDSGLPLLRWTMTWINDSNVAAVNAAVSDPIPSGVTYSAAGASSGYPVPGGAPAGSTQVGVTCEPDPTSITTTTTLCYYEGPTVTYPRGRIIWEGTLGADLGATNATNADNEIVIRFNVVVDTGTTSAFNTATIDSDLNGDDDITDPGEQAVATASSQWNLVVDPGVSSLPDTGFAPGKVTSLPVQPDWLTYNATDLVLEIPSLDKKISIMGIPYTANGWDVTWLGNQAGYLDGTAFPTWAGNSVITGHVYLPNGLPGPFVDLGQLRYGDQIIVHFAGQRYIYQIRESKVVSPRDRSVFKHEDYSWLTLVTCKDFNETTDTYARRVVVRAVLIKVE
jgi:LPXTG-site transpeptidase (sortase) family protein